MSGRTRKRAVQIKNVNLLDVFWHHVLQLLLQRRVIHKHWMFSYQLSQTQTLRYTHH